MWLWLGLVFMLIHERRTGMYVQGSGNFLSCAIYPMSCLEELMNSNILNNMSYKCSIGTSGVRAGSTMSVLCFFTYLSFRGSDSWFLLPHECVLHTVLGVEVPLAAGEVRPVLQCPVITVVFARDPRVVFRRLLHQRHPYGVEEN